MIHEANEAVKGEGQGGCVDAGMEAEVRGLEEVLVEKDAYVMLGVVDEGEGGDGAGRDAEVTLQAVLGGEGELALVEAMLDGMDVHRAVAGEDDEVVTVALVIAEEEVLAEVDVAVTEDFAGYVEGGEWGMLDVVEGDVETSQEGVEWGGTDHGGGRRAYSVRSMRAVKRRVMTSVARLAARTTSSASLTKSSAKW